MMGLSLPHLIVLALVVLLLFGRGKISELMGDFGKGVKSFKQGISDEANPAPAPPPVQLTAHPQPVPPPPAAVAAHPAPQPYAPAPQVVPAEPVAEQPRQV